MRGNRVFTMPSGMMRCEARSDSFRLEFVIVHHLVIVVEHREDIVGAPHLHEFTAHRDQLLAECSKRGGRTVRVVDCTLQTRAVATQRGLKRFVHLAFECKVDIVPPVGRDVSSFVVEVIASERGFLFLGGGGAGAILSRMRFAFTRQEDEQ